MDTGFRIEIKDYRGREMLRSEVSLDEYVYARRRWNDAGLFAREREDDYVTVALYSGEKRISSFVARMYDWPEILHRYYDPAFVA